MDQNAWWLVEAIAALDGDDGAFLARAIRCQVEESTVPFTQSVVLNLLEDLRSALPITEAMTLLEEAGLLRLNEDGVPYQVTLASTTVGLDRLREKSANEGVLAALDAWTMRQLIGRVHRWVEEISQVAHDQRLAGMPTFWTCAVSGDVGLVHEPLAEDVGSMTSLDVIALWSETLTSGQNTEPGEGIVWLLKKSLEMQDNTASSHHGAIWLADFDDDFVYNFDTDKGSYPTLDATANACSAWMRFIAEAKVGDSDIRATVSAIVSGLKFVMRSQREDGSWAVAIGEGLFGLGPDVLATRLAVLALADAIDSEWLPGEVREACLLSLHRAARFLTATVDPNRGCWSRSFTNTSTDTRNEETTALLLEPLRRLGGIISSELEQNALEFVGESFRVTQPHILRAEFRVPTWNGVSSSVQVWDLPFGAIVATAVASQQCPSAALVGPCQAALARLVRDEVHGHWYDLGGLEEGKWRAFPSNSLLNVRALVAWARTYVHLLEGITTHGTSRAPLLPTGD